MERNFDEIVNRYHTNSVKYDLIQENNKPEDVIPMWVADMDFKVPVAVEEAVTKVAQHGIYGYSSCPDSYYEAVIQWFGTRFDTKIDKDWIVTTPGVVTAIGMAIRAFTNELDGVMIQRPVYYPFGMMIERNNRRIVNCPLQLKEQSYEMDFELMDSLMTQENVKMFILCNPHNPVGKVWRKEDLEKVVEICKKHQVLIVSDEIHCDFVYSGFQHHMLLKIAPEYQDQMITCTAPSKTFNLAGMQTSNIFIPDEVKRVRFVEEMDKVSVGMVSPMGMAACEAAYRHGFTWLEELKIYLEENRKFIEDFLAKEIPEVSLLPLEGTYLVWFDFRQLGLTNDKLETMVVDKMKLWFDGGIMFGEEGIGFQRMNIACPRSVIEKAMNQMKNGLGI